MQKDNLNIKKVSIFEGNEYFAYVYKKAEKISMVVYMITDFFADTEPLKREMRQASISLVDMSLRINLTLSPDRKTLLNGLITNALKLASYSEIAALTGIESIMNHNILKAELEHIVELIEEREHPDKIGRNFSIPTTVLEDRVTLSDEGMSFKRVEVGDRSLAKKVSTQQKQFSNGSAAHVHKTTSGSVVHVAGSYSSKSDSRKVTNTQVKDIQKNSAPSGYKGQSSGDKSQRQQTIIATVKTKGEVSIKDIADVIKDCSEKTLQRELMSLVDQRVLNKTGERRWSKYSLV